MSEESNPGHYFTDGGQAYSVQGFAPPADLELAVSPLSSDSHLPIWGEGGEVETWGDPAIEAVVNEITDHLVALQELTTKLKEFF